LREAIADRNPSFLELIEEMNMLEGDEWIVKNPSPNLYPKMIFLFDKTFSIKAKNNFFKTHFAL